MSSHKYPKAALNVFRDGKFYKQINKIGTSDCMTFGKDGGKCDSVLVHPSASDVHAVISQDEHGNLQLLDLDSEQGTRVNGSAIRPNEPLILNNDDVITFAVSTRQYIVSLDGHIPPSKHRSPQNKNSRKRKLGDDGKVGEVRASHILVKHRNSRNPSSWKEDVVTRSEQQAMDKIVEYKRQIENGTTSFNEIAREHSECSSHSRNGDLGKFGRGKMQKPFEDVAFGLAVGEMSEPVKTNSGIHLIKRTE